MSTDVSQIVALALGAAGTILGVLNYGWARHERRQKNKTAYAVALLSLNPILDKILNLPPSLPEDLSQRDAQGLIAALAEIEASLDAAREKLVQLVPEFAAHVLELLHSSREFEAALRVQDHSARCVAFRNYYHFAYRLSLPRSHSVWYGIHLHDQVRRSNLDMFADQVVNELANRYRSLSQLCFLQEITEPPANTAP